jgi:large subunit ribosomal protein L35
MSRAFAYRTAGRTGMPGRFSTVCRFYGLKQPVGDGPLKIERVKMPKLKTKSGAKKRFKLTATGKVKAGVAGKRHRLISHNSKYIRQNRGTKVMADADAKKIKSYMPYA